MIDVWTTRKKVTEKKIRYNPYEKIYSNCITEIPDNIRVELENNVLTLKAGSILTRDETTYSTITTTQDVTYDLSNRDINTRYMLFVSKSATPYSRVYRLDKTCSGATDTMEGASWHVWFDTETKQIKTFGGDGTTITRMCYPLCAFDVDSNGIASFAKDSKGRDLIFNGAGFIGHHAFIYPNVKALIPKGFNEDGSLNSKEVIINSLRIAELIFSKTNVVISGYSAQIDVNKFGNAFINKEEIDDLATYHYIKSENLNYVRDNASSPLRWREYMNFVNYTYDGTIVTDFTIRQPYEGAAEQTLYEPEEYEVEYDRTFLNVGDTAVFKAKNILETQEQSLDYEPDLGIDLKRFLDPDVKIQNRTFEAYSIQKLSEQGINTIELLSDKETFRQLFDYKVAETDKEGMIAQ